jgi:hypothetical protein
MSVIQQFNLPPEIQLLIREFAFYSEIEHKQRKKKQKLLNQLGRCGRLIWEDDTHMYDYFYYKMENWNIYTNEKNTFYVTQEINIMSAIFCKCCHEYVFFTTPIPERIECGCLHDIVDVD